MGPEQQQSFDELKKRVSSAETLGYFDKNTTTEVRDRDSDRKEKGKVYADCQGMHVKARLEKAIRCY